MALDDEPTIVTRAMSDEVFEALIEHLPDAVVFADLERRMEFVSKGFVEMFGYEPEEVIGENTRMLYANPSDFSAQGSQRFNPKADVVAGAYIVEYRRKDGTVFLGETRGVPVRDADGRTLGYMGIVRDVTKMVRDAEELQIVRHELAERLNRSQLLFDLSTREYQGVEDLLEFTLARAAKILGEQTAIFSRIAGQQYVIEAFVSQTGQAVERGTVFELGNTYCSIMLDSGGVLQISHMGQSEHAGHPCYENFALESYIGAPVEIGGKVVGTLNFTSSTPRVVRHPKVDEEFVTMLAGWLGVFFDRAQTQQRLARQNQNLDAMVELQDLLQRAELTQLESVRAFGEFLFEQVDILGLAVAVFDGGRLRVVDAQGSLDALSGNELPEQIVPETPGEFERPSLQRWQTSRSAMPGASMTLCANLSYAGQSVGALVVDVRGQDAFDRRDRPITELSAGLLAARLSVVRQYERAQHEATTDSLTGLSNRRESIRRIEHARRNAPGAPIELAILDVDEFKKVNDTHGHLVGDAVLRTLADTLQAHFPDAVATGRLGGEEFIVATHTHGEARLAGALREMLQAFGAHKFSADGETFLVTFSAGAAQLGESEDIYAAIERADAGLYEAKRGGRARVVG